MRSRHQVDANEFVPGAMRPRSVSAPGDSRAPVLRLQATAGNAAVAALIASRRTPTIQRLWDTDEENEEPHDSDAQTPAEDRGDDGAVQSEIERSLHPDTVVDSLAPIAGQDEELGDYESPGSGPTAQALFIQRDPPDAEPPPTRAGGPGDVLKALMPYLKPALDKLKADVLETLAKLKAGEAVATAIVVAPILIGPLTQPGPRKFALDQLDGTDVTFGVIPNLQLKPQISDGQLRGGTLTYDLAPALRKLGVPW